MTGRGSRYFVQAIGVSEIDGEAEADGPMRAPSKADRLEAEIPQMCVAQSQAPGLTLGRRAGSNRCIFASPTRTFGGFIR